jgi:hypothetical protein
MDMNFLDRINTENYKAGSPWGWSEIASDHAEPVLGVDLGVTGSDNYGITIDKGMLKILIDESVRDYLGEKENKPVVIQKYKMKHK